MKKVLFIDRDGTILREPEDEQIDSLDKFQFLPGAIRGLARLARETDFSLVLVTNQDGLGTGSFPEEHFWPAQNLMLSILRGEGVEFDEIHVDRSFPHEGAPTRKPGTGMLLHHLKGDTDLSGSYVIGDRVTDLELARNLGCAGILVADGGEAGVMDPSGGFNAELVTPDWDEIATYLCGRPRSAEIHRLTRETDILIRLNLDGDGEAELGTGLGFLDHMLEQIARHGGMDLFVRIDGDLHVDEHHVVEDCALALGSALDKALGSRKGIGRYGFMLPMDDALARVALDLGGRPWLVWQADFRRERIGDVPTEMFRHFFKSFCDTARCNLNILAEGENEHHKIEAVFKGFARCLRQAAARTGDAGSLPSTKGML